MTRIALLLASLGLCAPALAQAQVGSDEPPARPAGESKQTAPLGCSPARPAIERLVSTVASQIGQAPEGVLVVSAALETDAPATRPDALALLLAQQLAGRISPAARAHGSTASLDEARQAAAKSRAFVYLSPRIAGGQLHLTADVYPVPQTIWSRARARAPGPVAHAHHVAPLDAEIRSYLRPVPFVAAPAVAQFSGADPGVVALACGDLDGDLAPDLITVTRARVLQIRLREGRVERVREASWSELSPIAPAPFREPLAGAAIVSPPGFLDVAITDRARAVRLDPELRPVADLAGFALPSATGSACASLVDLRIGPDRIPCREGEPQPAMRHVLRPADAFAAALLVAPAGEARPIVALRREDASAVVIDRGQETVLGRAGAQIALGDVDQDGAPEIVTTVDTLAPSFDAVEVRTLHPSGRVESRYRLPVPTGVEAVAVCPPDGPGRAPVVLATSGQIWVLR